MREQFGVHEQQFQHVKGLVLVASYALFVERLLRPPRLFGRLFGQPQRVRRRRGVRPLCNLKSSILVSDSPNSDGNYTVIYNSAPSAPPSITAPATCYSGQNINISLRGGDRSGRRRADLLFRALIQQRRVDTGSSVRKQDVHGSGIDRVEHVKIPRPRKGQLRQLFRIHHKRRYCRNP